MLKENSGNNLCVCKYKVKTIQLGAIGQKQLFRGFLSLYLVLITTFTSREANFLYRSFTSCFIKSGGHLSVYIVPMVCILSGRTHLLSYYKPSLSIKNATVLVYIINNHCYIII